MATIIVAADGKKRNSPQITLHPTTGSRCRNASSKNTLSMSRNSPQGVKNERR